MTQNEKILQFLRTHKSMTQRDAIKLGCYRLGARIFDLKREGYDIKTRLRPVTNFDGSKSIIAFYSLEKSDSNE